MISDVQTIFSGNASTLDKIMAGGDLLLNVAMDATMVVGVGEGLKAAYVGAKAAAHVGEELGAHLVEHAGEDAAEHVAEHEAEDAAEHGLEDGAACALSFAASTLVATPSGERSIASLKPGEKVQAYDPATGKRSTQTVAATSVHRDANLVDVTLRVVVPVPVVPSKAAASTKAGLNATSGKGTTKPGATQAASTTTTTSTPRTRDETIQTTTNHPWLTADHGWLPAGFLHIGEPVQELDGAMAVVVSLKAVAGTAPMYDLSLDAVHTFAVGDGQFVVHNANCGETYQTYTVTNKETGEVYSGRTRGTGTPDENIQRRFNAGHERSGGSWGEPVLDKSSSNYEAIRGREQQLIDYYRSQGIAADQINGVGPRNRNYARYMEAAFREFGAITHDPRVR